MNVDVAQRILNVKGKPFMTEDNQPLTLGDVIDGSILAPMEGDGEKEKMEKYEVWKKVKDSKPDDRTGPNEEYTKLFVELTINDVALIKKCIGKTQPQLIMGQCFEMLEDAAKK